MSDFLSGASIGVLSGFLLCWFFTRDERQRLTQNAKNLSLLLQAVGVACKAIRESHDEMLSERLAGLPTSGMKTMNPKSQFSEGES